MTNSDLQATGVNNENAVAAQDKGAVMYSVAGQDVKLSYQIVRDFLVKGGGNVSDQDLVQFISICKFNSLNPFLGEAFLVKYGTSPASMIVSKEALMKRADVCPNYDGMQAGIIVKHEDGEIEDVEGSFINPGDILLGGWARVFRSDRKFPFVARVSLVEYDKKQSTWKEKPSTMIRKVAEVQALREAFPAQLGAMYTAEERGVEDAVYTEIKADVQQEKAVHANKTPVMFDDAESDKNEPSRPKTKIKQEQDRAADVPQTPGF